jgi:hypothetical protein
MQVIWDSRIFMNREVKLTWTEAAICRCKVTSVLTPLSWYIDYTQHTEVREVAAIARRTAICTSSIYHCSFDTQRPFNFCWVHCIHYMTSNDKTKWLWTAMRKYVAAPQLKRSVAGFPPRRPGFDPGSGQVGFVMDKVALGQVFSEYLVFSCQSSFHQLLHNHSRLSSGAGTIGQKWPQYK